MKKMKRFASAALAALLLTGSVPGALALDATPPLYQQFGYDSADEFMDEEAWFEMLDYDAASDLYRQHMDEMRKNPQLLLNQLGYDSMDALNEDIDWGIFTDLEDAYRSAALGMVGDDDWELHKQLTVQLNGDMIQFPDAKPEKVNGRVMVPFRAIAEALGAEVDYNAGAITAKKDGETLSFALGGKQLTVTDSAGKVVKTTPIDTAPYKKGGRTYVPVRFFAEGFGLNVQWDSYFQTAVLYDRAALVEELDSEFTVLTKWLKAQPDIENVQALRSTAAINAVYTAFDTLDGNRDYKVNAKLNILTDGKTTEATVTVDLRALADLTLGESAKDDIVGAMTGATLKAMLQNVTVDIIFDADSGDLYVRCPMLFKALAAGETIDDADMKAMADGGWLHIDLEQWGYSALFETLMSQQKNPAFTSVGESIVREQEAMAESGTWCDWEDFYQTVQNEKTSLAQTLGDELFTQSGSRYTAKFDTSDEDWGEIFKGSYTLNTADGSLSGSIERRSTDTKTTASFSGDLRNCKLTLTIHTKNESEIKLDMTLGTTASADKPKNTPPEGSTIVEMEQEGVSTDYPDGWDSSIE